MTADSRRMPASEDQLFALMHEQESEHALIVLDTDRRVVAWRGAAAKMFGYSAAEMQGGTIDRLFTPEDRARGEVENEFSTALSYGRADDDRWLVRKDNARLWASGVLTVLRTADGRVAGFSKVFRDRTEVRSQIESLRNRLDATIEADNRKNIFIATLAHELRNPLGPLSNAAHIIRLSFLDHPGIGYPLRIIERQVQFIEGLVGDLLDLTRIGTGKLVLKFVTVSMREVIDAAVETCSTQLQDKEQTLEVLMPATMMVDADALRLQQVLVNLIGNASKFSPAKSKIWVKATVEGEEAVVRIEDKGRGIPSELLPKIFELFTQAGAPVHDEKSHSGLGLGLTLVKSLVEAHDGTVQARSEGVGKGAELSFRIPLRRSTGSVIGGIPGGERPEDRNETSSTSSHH
jgi:PAS domain S-box-containing protein